MITQLKGVLDGVEEQSVVLDVNGVGYQVFCSARTLSTLPAVGAPLNLLIEMVVREDAMLLYGFPSRAERDWFRLLVTVQGVGMKVALSLLAIGDVSQIAHAIATQDKAFIARADGVGPKLALRIVTELREKVAKMPMCASGGTSTVVPFPVPSNLQHDAISALTNLGYKPSEAEAAVAATTAALEEDADLSTLIRHSLTRLSKV